jgi:hypothetical protein
LEQFPSDEILERRSPWHIYPKGWDALDWLVPYTGDNAVIHHGHSDPSDHSLCGPTLFCCANSRQLFIDTFPEGEESNASWEVTGAEHIATWLEAGVQVLYFIFCDPVRPGGLLAGGLNGEEARQVLFKEVLIEHYAGRAARLR